MQQVWRIKSAYLYRPEKMPSPLAAPPHFRQVTVKLGPSGKQTIAVSKPVSRGSLEDCKITKKKELNYRQTVMAGTWKGKFMFPFRSTPCSIVKRREGEGVLENKPVPTLPACLLCLCVLGRAGGGEGTQQGKGCV